MVSNAEGVDALSKPAFEHLNRQLRAGDMPEAKALMIHRGGLWMLIARWCVSGMVASDVEGSCLERVPMCAGCIARRKGPRRCGTVSRR